MDLDLCTSIYFSFCLTYLFSQRFFLPSLLIRHTAFLHLDLQSRYRDGSKKESGVVGWFLEKAVEAPLIRGACVRSVEVSAVLVVKEVPEPPRAFSHQANHVFTLPQRSELILTSNCRMGKLKPAMQTGKIWISSGLSFRLVFSVNGHDLLLDSDLAI